MKNPLKKDDTKTYNLSREELAELGYLAQKQSEYSEIMQMYADKIAKFQARVEASKAIDKDKYFVNWGQVFTEGKIVAILKPPQAEQKGETASEPAQQPIPANPN